jgi:CDP-2,3-bis-(O-geranylgeranyl)-sn-glycerol synthase
MTLSYGFYSWSGSASRTTKRSRQKPSSVGDRARLQGVEMVEHLQLQPFSILQALVLLTLANGTPVIAKKVFGQSFALPLDAGLAFFDGRPMFGPSKTIRGILLSIVVTTAGAPLIGLDLSVGALAAAAAKLGDLCSSFVKRRLNFPPSSQALGIDQLPESLLPLLACRAELSLTAADIAFCVGMFFIGELVSSRILYRAHLRDEPY